MINNTKISYMYIRKDLEEIITEKFAKHYFVDLSKWIAPFGYYDEYSGSIRCREGFPDGTYAALGRVKYPGKRRFSYYTIYQFNVCRSRGIELRWANRFNPYPNVPNAINLQPAFPLIKVGELTDYISAKKAYQAVRVPLTIDEIKSKIKLSEDAVQAKVFKLRLALQREIDKEK